MGRKRGTKELRQEKTVIIGAGITEQWYFSHLKTLFKLNILIRPRFFGKENIAALEKRIKQVLEARNKAIVVFDADVSAWNHAERVKLNTLREKYINSQQVVLCDSMPSIEYWFLLHYVNTNRYFETSEAVVTELVKYITNYEKSAEFLGKLKWVSDLCADDHLKMAFQRARSLGLEGGSYSNVWKAIGEVGIVF